MNPRNMNEWGGKEERGKGSVDLLIYFSYRFRRLPDRPGGVKGEEGTLSLSSLYLILFTASSTPPKKDERKEEKERASGLLV